MCSIQNTYQVLADKHSYQSSKAWTFISSQATLKLVIFPYSEQAETVESRKGRLWGRAGLMVRTGFALARVLSTGNSETQAPAGPE